MSDFLELVLIFGTAMILGSILGLGVSCVIMRRTYGHWFPRRDCNCREKLEVVRTSCRLE